MAVIQPANLDPDSWLRVKGVVIQQPWKTLMVVRTWPRKRGKPTNPAVIFTSTQFGKAGKMAANSEPMQYETAREMTKGTHWLPRDLLVKAAYGSAYEIILPDGSTAPVTPKGPPQGA